jgi:hypothetical protein
VSDLARLIARLEAATDGTVSLSEEVARAVGWVSWRGQWFAPGTDPAGNPPSLDGAPNFTRSLDAALTLVPETAGIEINRYWLTTRDGAVWSAQLRWGLRDSAASEDAPSAPLALCIAALKARSAA